MAHRVMAKGREDADGRQRVRAIFECHDDGWTGWIVERPEVCARGASLGQVRKRLAALIARDPRDLSRAALEEELRLPPVAGDTLARLARARAELENAERDAVVVLVRGLGLMIRDVSDTLGLTMRRVVHLAGEAADAEADRKSELRAR